MLRASLRGSSSPLLRGSCPQRRSACIAGALKASTLLPTRLTEPSVALQRFQKRCYAVAAEDTNKGVVGAQSSTTGNVYTLAKFSRVGPKRLLSARQYCKLHR